MTRFPNVMLKPLRPRLAAAAAFGLGAACLFGSAGASAQASTPAAVQMAPVATTATHHHYRHHMARKSAVEHRETLDNRISTLHTDLNITPAEESAWAPVAQAMRDNDANMQKMVAARNGEASHEQTAVEALRTYERFSQAHVDGLKTLISSFETLYGGMPASQQAVADQVFKHFGHHDHAVKS